MKVTAVSILLAGLLAHAAEASRETFAIHGSGTTNPSKCIWHIMSLFEERSRVNTRLTYRAVGSSTGQLEFLGEENDFKPHSDFGAGDIPVPSEDYKALNLATTGSESNSNMVHLPFALSSVTFFHNIPGVPDGKDGLNLNACLLARIFDGKIRFWNDSEIVAENGHLKAQLEAVAEDDTPIYVARRVHGSSSTSSITKYLHQACPNEWPASKVGSELGAKGLDPWHVSTKPCQGSSVMTSCIRDNDGSIGYLDSGHGWGENLTEVNVQNKDTFFVSSWTARENGGITSAAAMTSDIPSTVDGDWGDVHFINKSGEWTWPIVVMSYVYVRKDINLIVPEAEERGLLKLFLESLYDPEYFGRCEGLGFSDVPAKLSERALEGIQSLAWNFPNENNNENMWSQEYKSTTRKIDGMGPYVISGKRRNLAGITIDEMAGIETAEQKRIAQLEAIVAELAGGASIDEVMGTGAKSNDDNKAQAALVLGALSFTVICCVAVGLVVNRFFLGGKSYSLAVPQGNGV